MNHLQQRTPLYLLIKSGRGAGDCIAYINAWQPFMTEGMSFYDFETAKQALCFLIKDELELLSEKYNLELEEFKKKNVSLYNAGLAYLLSTSASFTVKKLKKMYQYYELAKAAKSFEELDFKFFLLSSELSGIVSFHFDIMNRFKVVEHGGDSFSLYLLKKPDGSSFAIKKYRQHAILVHESELESIAQSLAGQVSILETWAKNMKKKA